MACYKAISEFELTPHHSPAGITSANEEPARKTSIHDHLEYALILPTETGDNSEQMPSSPVAGNKSDQEFQMAPDFDDDNTQSTESSTLATTKDPNNPEACLTGVPSEVQDMILDLLLVNPDLRRRTSNAQHSQYSILEAYGLEPAVMRTCQQLYDRSVGVQDGLDTFCIACMPDGWDLSRGEGNPSSPITRY